MICRIVSGIQVKGKAWLQSKLKSNITWTKEQGQIERDLGLND